MKVGWWGVGTFVSIVFHWLRDILVVFSLRRNQNMIRIGCQHGLPTLYFLIERLKLFFQLQLITFPRFFLQNNRMLLHIHLLFSHTRPTTISKRQMCMLLVFLSLLNFLLLIKWIVWCLSLVRGLLDKFKGFVLSGNWPRPLWVGTLLLGFCQRWLQNACVYLLLDTICLLVFSRITVHKLLFKLSDLNLHSALMIRIRLIFFLVSSCLLLYFITRNIVIATALYDNFLLILLNICLL